MKVPLVELLSERFITHPSTIVSATIEPGHLEMVIRGAAWWEDKPAVSEVNFRFELPQDGALDLAQFGQ